MDFQVQLFVQTHRDGFFSVRVVDEPGLCVFTDDLDRAREDLMLVLGDRLERTHPRLLDRFAAPAELRHVEVTLPEGLLVDGAEARAGQPTRLSALVARDRRWLRLWLPRWDLRLWIDHHADVEAAVIEFLTAHFRKVTPGERLARRFEREERVEALTIEADPPGLERFTGKWLGASMLPEPAPKKDDEDDDPDGEKKTGKKKKRPPTPTLAAIGVNLTRQAKDGELPRAHGRDAEVTALLAALAAPGASAHVIIGEPGVGKTALLHELVHRARDENGPKGLAGRPVWFADASRLIAGEGWFGDWQRQCLDVVQECEDAEVIWLIGNALALLDAGKSAQSDQNVALLLKPFFAGRRVTVIAECTPRAYATLELRDLGFARLFSPFRLDEPERAAARAIVAAVAADLGKGSGVTVPPDGLRAVEELTDRFRGEGSRLGAALHFLRRAVEDAAQSEAEPRPPLDRSAMVERFCAETGMPVFLVRDDRPLDPESVLAHFRARIIGQDEAVARMTDLIALMKAGLGDSHRPLGSFLFVGPTGVGKTEMAKALAEFLFGRRDRLVRFDMSEFIAPDSAHRLIGDAGEEGQLISAIRRAPFCVLLLDEIEKAHKSVFDLLLQVLGEARLTDQAGRTADFRNTVVLMTSNLGVETFKSSVGFGGPAPRSFREHFLAEAERFFRPEFFNRIDHIVPFMPLERTAIEAITRRELSAFLGREGLRQRDLRVELADDVHDWIAARGVEPRYGARPLKRLIEQRVAAPLARFLSGTTVPTGARLSIAAEGEALRFAAHEGGKARAAAASQLRRLLDAIGGLRDRLQRWLNSTPYRELAAAIRLLDRLSQTRNFWEDRERAEQRMRHTQRDRDLRDAFAELNARVAGLEDLAYEAWAARNAEPYPLFVEELDAIEAALAAHELALYARRFVRPDRALIYCQASADGLPFLRRLYETWLAIAAERGWQVSARFAVEDPQHIAARDAKAATKEGEGTVHRGRRARRSQDREAWSWQSAGELTPPTQGEDEASQRKRREQFLMLALGGEPEAVRALRFEGEHAAALLAGESGVHEQQGVSGSPRVRVRFADRADTVKHPLDLAAEWVDRRKRIVHEGQRLVRDLDLDLAIPLEPRLHKIYQRFMDAHRYDEVFGPGSHRLFSRRGTR